MTDIENHPVFKPITKWYAAEHDDSPYHGGKGSRFDIISYAVSEQIGGDQTDQRFHIMQGTKQGLRLSDDFGASDIIDYANYSNEEYWKDADTPPVKVSTEELDDLTRRVKKAIDEWQISNGLRFELWPFSETAHEEGLVLVDGFDGTGADNHCFRRCADRGEPPCFDLPRHSSDAWSQTITPCAECFADAEGERKAKEQAE